MVFNAKTATGKRETVTAKNQWREEQCFYFPRFLNFYKSKE